MALTFGDPNPDVTTTQTATTTAPDWYNNFISGLSTAGTAAVDSGGVAAFDPLQTQAFTGAPAAITAGQPALDAATAAATGVATTSFMDNVGDYMNPYTKSVIEEMNRLGQKQFNETLAPGMTAGTVGSGQFGSKRGMQVYGNTARDVNKDILGAQAKYLAQGFDQATAMAKAEAELDIAASGRLGELSTRAYDQGVGGLDVLSRLGAQKQSREQALLDYDMGALTKYANMMRGFSFPTSVTDTRTGPMTKDYYQAAPLNQILSFLTGAGGLLTKGTSGKTVLEELKAAYGPTLSKIPGLSDILKTLGIGGTGGTTGGTGGDGDVGSDTPYDSDDEETDTPYDFDDEETGVGVDLTGGTGEAIDYDPYDFDYDPYDYDPYDFDYDPYDFDYADTGVGIDLTGGSGVARPAAFDFESVRNALDFGPRWDY